MAGVDSVGIHMWWRFWVYWFVPKVHWKVAGRGEEDWTAGGGL